MKEKETWEELLQKVEQKNKTSRLWLALAIAVPVVLIGLFLFRNQKEKAKVEQQAIEVNQLRESIADSINVQATLTAQLKQRTLQYMDVLNKKNLDSLQAYYADTLDWYYINLKHASRIQVRDAENFWFKKKPHAHALVDSLDVSFSKGQSNAYLNIRYSEDSTNFKPIFMVIKFNPQGQITFVKSYNNEVRDR